MNDQPTPKRPARPGETCSCGEPAIEVVIFDDLGAIPSCGKPRDDDGHKPADCPPWCAKGHHSIPFDLRHDSESYEIPLDAHPYQQRVNGAWETYFQSLLVGLTKEPSCKPTYIELVSVGDESVGRLTAYEAEQLAEALQKLAATLRAEGQA